MKKTIILMFVFMMTACSANTEPSQTLTQDETGSTIETRFAPPPGFQRAVEDEGSFAFYLRSLPLKPKSAKVKYYDGREKANPGVYIAVVDMPISKRDLQQCADAVIRLKGEWLYAQKRYDEIKFNFVADGKPRYYKDYAKGDYSYEKFLKYMDWVFAYANTASLHDELRPVKDFSDMRAGDVFVQKGRPYGHAVIVVDTAQNAAGEKVYMLAQSYMPAQETQLLQNPKNPKLSPWYELKDGIIYTPEWTFYPQDLRRF